MGKSMKGCRLADSHERAATAVSALGRLFVPNYQQCDLQADVGSAIDAHSAATSASN